jgi:hypothetical protein
VRSSNTPQDGTALQSTPGTAGQASESALETLVIEVLATMWLLTDGVDEAAVFIDKPTATDAAAPAGDQVKHHACRMLCLNLRMPVPCVSTGSC